LAALFYVCSIPLAMLAFAYPTPIFLTRTGRAMKTEMVPLSELSVWIRPPGDWLMAALTYRGTFDDSGDEDDPYHTCASLGGYVGPVDAWNDFETEWQSVLDEFDISYLHMKEFLICT
jgi:hypothetical protein